MSDGNMKHVDVVIPLKVEHFYRDCGAYETYSREKFSPLVQPEVFSR